MGNYFNELRWKIIRANNLLQLIHQVTIEIRFRKSLAQERFKSNLEFRNQIKVSSIKFWKCFAKFMIPIALFKKLRSLLWFLLWFFSLGPLAYFHKNKIRLLPLRWHDTLCPVYGSETLRVSGDQLYQHFLCLMACEVEPAYTGSLIQQQCHSSSQPSGNWSGALATWATWVVQITMAFLCIGCLGMFWLGCFCFRTTLGVKQRWNFTNQVRTSL